jgi:MFS family permease
MLALGLSVLALGFSESADFSVVTVGLHHSAAFLGVLTTVQGAGAVLGGMAAAPLLKRVSEPALLTMGLACLTLAMLALTVADLAVVLAGMVVAGFVGPWVGVAAVTAFQRRTPTAMTGRVFGVLRLVLTIPQAASIGIGAALITVVSYRVLLLVITVAAAASALLVIGQPEIRRRALLVSQSEISSLPADMPSGLPAVHACCCYQALASECGPVALANGCVRVRGPPRAALGK